MNSVKLVIPLNFISCRKKKKLMQSLLIPENEFFHEIKRDGITILHGIHVKPIGSHEKLFPSFGVEFTLSLHIPCHSGRHMLRKNSIVSIPCYIGLDCTTKFHLTFEVNNLSNFQNLLRCDALYWCWKRDVCIRSELNFL